MRCAPLLLLLLLAPAPAGAGPSARAAADSGRAWRAVEFPLEGEGLGVCLEVAGRVQLTAAEIVFASGECRRIALRAGRVYGRGIWALAQFDGLRRVARVRLALRTRARHTRLRPLLLRGDPTPPPTDALSGGDDRAWSGASGI